MGTFLRLSIILALLGLSGCYDDETPSPDPTPAPTPETPAEPVEAPEPDPLPPVSEPRYALPEPIYKATRIPDNAERYKRLLIRSVNYAWGLDGSPAMAAAQIHKESTWNPQAKSPYAGGLAQFTPPTREDMARWYPDVLKGFDEYDPAQALMAQSLYNKRLWDRFERLGVTDECQRSAFMLSAYNGGLGWLIGFKKKTGREPGDRGLAEAAGEDKNIWWGSVEQYTNRSEAARNENRDYPRKILLWYQHVYADAGFDGKVYCLSDWDGSEQDGSSNT